MLQVAWVTRNCSDDQKTATACFDLGVAGLQVGFILEHLFDIEHGAVLGLLPADIALGKFDTSGCAHGLLQDLLELHLARLLLSNALANRLELQVDAGQFCVLTEIQSLAVILGIEVAQRGFR